MTKKLDKLYGQYLKSFGDRTGELLDAIVAEVCRESYGDEGDPYRYVYERGHSAFGPVKLSGYEGVRAVIDHDRKRIKVVASMKSTYLATIAMRALISDSNAAVHGYAMEVQCALIPRRRNGKVLLEGGAYDTLLTLFRTPPKKVWVVGQGAEENDRANRYLEDPQSLKEAVVDNMRYQLERLSSNDVLNLTQADVVRISAYEDAFQGLMYFAQDKSEWQRWAKTVLPAWRKFASKHPYHARLLRRLESSLSSPIPDADKPMGQFSTINMPSLLRRDW